MNLLALFYLMIGVGILILVAALTNWAWFFKQRRAQSLIKLVGRNGARVFYGVMGALFCVIGWMVISGRIVLDSVF